MSIKRVTGEEKAVIQEEETFERVDGFYIEVEYKGDIYTFQTRKT